MTINSKTKVMALIGHPVSHSFSPQIHNGIANRKGLNALYVAHDVQPEVLSQALQGMAALDYTGANVTIPHKEAVIGLLDEVDEIANWVGAVNTILFEEGQLRGTNTDVFGFTEMMKSAGVDLAGSRVAVLGTGGASKAVIVACALADAAQIDVYSRSQKSANNCLDNWSGQWTQMNRSAKTYDSWLEHAGDYDLVVNCTPLGMGNYKGKMPVDPSLLKENAVVADLIYNPAETALLRSAQQLGLQTVNGLNMLIYQAVRSFRHWTGVDADPEAVRNDLRTNGIIE